MEFARYVPQVVRKRLKNGKELSPECHIGYGTIMFLDICGFTTLAESLGLEAGGAEHLGALAARIL